MRFTRASQNFGSRAPLQMFDCAMCGLSVTEAVEVVDQAAHRAA